MLRDELDRLQGAQGFVDGAADGEVVDGGVVENAVGGDDVEAAEGEARVLVQAWRCVLGAVRKIEGEEEEEEGEEGKRG